MPARITSRLWTAAIAIFVAALTGNAQQPEKPRIQTLKLDVDLVLVNATVTDSENRYVTGLDQKNFQLWEDKVEQKIEYFSSEEAPLSLGIVLDISRSMKEKISIARNAVVTFLKTGSPEDEYFLLEFGNRADVVEDFTTDITRLQDHLIFGETKGTTALYDAIYLALEKVKKGSNPKKAILLITDGEDNRSRYSFANVKEISKESDVQIYAIGIAGGSSSSYHESQRGRFLIEELTNTGGGRAFFPGSVYELEDIAIRIAVELKNQYVLGYISTNQQKDGKWRKIRVKIDPPKGLPDLHVRAKSGYPGPVE